MLEVIQEDFEGEPTVCVVALRTVLIAPKEFRSDGLGRNHRVELQYSECNKSTSRASSDFSGAKRYIC